ncbi:Hypothetical protein GbCGDNIH3_1455 [Granulibacter bethesdensis]|uniref:ABC-type transport auxiliary lipoprotein component domain-containing protein n=1 Tax=Granulibacter bethesdensis TaxID=364410 RepID=A0AAN0VG03_9PROT|nr:PqiC family protein [Granulibacter bethesdensis]AHJ63346.1 Hypothetical protein GbCGDNIH3_1455 [Granulibacter bethesdensis]AHJ66080.1 Hypothetical protein GbCGDNIH4_1455 [Granulibacter bethesdensis CGDNIH4]
MRHPSALALSALLLFAGCAAPALRVYTLSAQESRAPAPESIPARQIIGLSRVQVPDYLDTQDIILRHGQELHRSSNGRWATRLSLGITAAIGDRLATRWPDAQIVQGPQSQSPDSRIQIVVTRFDVGEDGQALLEAGWTITRIGSKHAPERDRTVITASGPIKTDDDIARMMRSMLLQLADRIVRPAK